MTQIEKEQFLGNYIGCEIEWLREDDNKWITVTLTTSDFSFLVKKNCRLIAKSIESITDEDAIEVIGKELYEFNRDNENDGYFGFSASGMFLDMIEFYKNDRSSTDFLRSKGYLPPFRQYSTEQLIESGIVKI